MNNQSYIYTLLFFLGAFILNAQQSNDLKFNFNNQFIYNPSMTSTWGQTDISLFHQKQFTGIEKAPTNSFISAQTMIPGQNLGVGLAINNQSAGLLSRTAIDFAASYKLKQIFTDSDHIGLGLSVESSFFGIDHNSILAVHEDDGLIDDGVQNAFGMNIGFGFNYQSNQAFVLQRLKPLYQFGFSLVQAIPGTVNFESLSYEERIHFYTHAGVFIGFTGGTYSHSLLEVYYEGKNLLNINFSNQVIVNQLLVFGASIDLNMDLGFQVGYMMNNLGGGDLKILAGAVLPLGIINNSVNSGYSISLVYGLKKRRPGF